ncbi:uncharacterized protein LOC111032732 [Myzus persicae]|uniref:uncharacterized protein LOC111032732 n=1 Tax=Myzus persicae TaxID=13164 RepID=UPI000B931F74|nr:uncharacterized protein LOC111032732 [Myzus persicae]
MAEKVESMDPHRFDDLFYAFKQLFMHRSLVEIFWSENFSKMNFQRLSAFPIDVVRPYVQRMLRVHGSGPLLHTIIAANFECKPMPSNTEQFAFIVASKTTNNIYSKIDKLGLISACGLDNQMLVDHDKYHCLRCGVSIQGMELDIIESLQMHAMVCEMLIDRRYLEPLKSFWAESDQKAYTNFLHKSLAQTMLTKLGLLIPRPRLFDHLPLSAILSNRIDSLSMVLVKRRRLLLDDEALDRIAQAGYHADFNNRLPYDERKREHEQFTRTPVDKRKITCFYCYHEVTLSVEFVSDPWRYHAMKSPACLYLLMNKGSEYIKQIEESKYDLRSRKNKIDRYKAIIDPKLNLRPPTTPMGELFDLREGVMERKKTELRVALSSTKVPSCVVCFVKLRTVALMRCLHFATCGNCSFSIHKCPFCRIPITGYMMPVYQPDGSFWKQPDCVGGNYFLNLPCCHLIESCVPNNVDRCPKADAVEEDEIYCVVCGDSKLGKLRLYM